MNPPLSFTEAWQDAHQGICSIAFDLCDLYFYYSSPWAHVPCSSLSSKNSGKEGDSQSNSTTSKCLKHCPLPPPAPTHAAITKGQLEWGKDAMTHFCNVVFCWSPVVLIWVVMYGVHRCPPPPPGQRFKVVVLIKHRWSFLSPSGATRFTFLKAKVGAIILSSLHYHVQEVFYWGT